MLPLHHAIINSSPFSVIRFLIEFYPEALRFPNANHHLPFHLIFLHCNDLNVFQFLRANYNKEFDELMAHPTIRCDIACYSAQKCQQQVVHSLQNETGMGLNGATQHFDLKEKNPLKRERDHVIIKVSLKIGVLTWRLEAKLDSNDIFSSSNHCDRKESRTDENIEVIENDNHLPKEKRRRIITSHASTSTSVSHAMSESNRDLCLLDVEELADNNSKCSMANANKKLTSAPHNKKWSEDTVDVMQSNICLNTNKNKSHGKVLPKSKNSSGQSMNQIKSSPTQPSIDKDHVKVLHLSNFSDQLRVHEMIFSQKGLDESYAGGWQSTTDLPDRRQMVAEIVNDIEKTRPDTNKANQK